MTWKIDGVVIMLKKSISRTKIVWRAVTARIAKKRYHERTTGELFDFNFFNCR
jgi:hypothetical protein